VSSFLTAHQHILGYLVPYHGMVDLHKKEDILRASSVTIITNMNAVLMIGIR